MKIHSKVGLVTNSSSEVYAYNRGDTLSELTGMLIALNPALAGRLSYQEIDYEGNSVLKMTCAYAAYELTYPSGGSYWGNPRMIFYDTDIVVDDESTWTEPFRAIVEALMPLIKDLVPIEISMATDGGEKNLSLHNKVLVLVDGIVDDKLTEAAKPLLINLIQEKGRYEYR